MKIKQLFSVVAMLVTSLVSVNAHAGAHYDKHGNVGYDTAAECDAAVQAGTAKFYQSFTHKSPLLRKGEKSVQEATIKDLGDQYKAGACDLGVGHKLGRDGVSKKLQGKFIPFSPDMPVNVYLDGKGNAVRVSMQQCDNWFSGNAPRPVEVLVAKTPAPIEPTITPTEVATAPVATTPSTSAAAPAIFAGVAGLGAYAFGTIGAHSEEMHSNGRQPSFYSRGIFKDTSTTAAGQVGVGLQLNKWLGGEVYVQGGQEKKYISKEGNKQDLNRYEVGTRLVLGHNVTDKLRVFGKAGVAAVHQDDHHPQFTVGAGAVYQLTDKLGLRWDYDHAVKRSDHIYYDNMGFGKSHYTGLGLQYKFK